MKPSIFKISTILFFLLSGHFSIGGIDKSELGKSIPSFMVTERSIDKNLKKGESKFEFKFYLDNGNYKGGIQIGMNDSSFIKTMNMANTITEKTTSGYYKLYFYVEGYYEVIEDSFYIESKEVVKAEIRFTSADPKMIITVDKPVIYVYPDKEMEVSIQLNINGELGFTYPTYNNGWEFIASPNGNISMNGNHYNYLFWDSKMDANKIETDNSGFLVASDTLLSFLENSLSQMGLNSKESADFITYWYPRMKVNEKNYIHFLFNEACNTYAELKISPQPDNVFRVGMVWSKTNSSTIPVPQTISKVNRSGFAVIEWGGTEKSNLINPEN